MQFFIGTYSSDEGSGVVALHYDSVSRGWRLGEADQSITGCSYGAYNALADLHYLIDEEASTVCACRWTEGGGWTCLQRASTEGDGPCFVELQAAAEYLAVANYESGTIALFGLDEVGGLEAYPLVYGDRGCGPNGERQGGPHAHCVRFHGQWLYSTDLGTDSVIARRLGPSASASDVFCAFKAPAGQGPRHIVFHPERAIAYLLTELGSTVFVLQVQPDGNLVEQARQSTLPADFSGESLGGHLALNARGDRLYVTNRGHDSLAVFAVGGDGNLTLMNHVKTPGASPRFFCLAESIECLIVAHEEGNCVAIFDFGENGLITEVNTILPIPKPAYVGQL